MKTPLRMPVPALALLLAPLLSAGAAERKASVQIPVVPVVNAGSIAAPQLPNITVPAGITLPAGLTTANLPSASVNSPAASGRNDRFPQAQAEGARPVAGAPQAAPMAREQAPEGRQGLPQAANAENTGRIVAQLSPENSARVSGEDASVLAGKMLDPRAITGASGVFAASAPDAPKMPAASLAPWQRKGAYPEDEEGIGTAGSHAIGSHRASWRERLHYGRLWGENLYFYIVTNIVNKWGQHQGDIAKLKAAGVTPPVSKQKEFFAYMRVMGQTGEFYVPGFTPRYDDKVLEEARETFAKYFDGPGITDDHRRAFEGFLQRAIAYNAERRAASKFRANVRDSMLKASVMDPSKMVAFFDGLPIVKRTAEFQNSAADAILEQFRQIALEEVAKEPKDAPDRVTGIILIGSFALGAATPTSDFDVEPLTADGGSGRVKDFSDRLKARWAAIGRQDINPVTFHMFGYLNSRWELKKIHHEPYLIISPDKAIVANLAMRPGEPNDHVPSRELKRKGKFLRWLQYAAVRVTMAFTRPKK